MRRREHPAGRMMRIGAEAQMVGAMRTYLVFPFSHHLAQSRFDSLLEEGVSAKKHLSGEGAGEGVEAG